METHLKWKLQACLGNEKQKSMFLVVSWLNVHFGFEHPILHVRAGAQVRLRARKVWRLEVNLFTPDLFSSKNTKNESNHCTP